MLNSALIKFTNYLGWLMGLLSLQKMLRPQNDARLIHYHGIGYGSGKCMRFLDDEVSPSAFEKHIDYLQTNYCLLSLDEVTELTRRQKLQSLEKPPCSITFDDGLSSVYTHAFPILKDRDIPFTVFVNTSVIDNNDLLWLHLLSYLFSSIGVESTIRNINSCVDDKALRLELKSSPASIEAFLRKHIEYFHDNNILARVLQSSGFSVAEVAQKENMYLTWPQLIEMCSHNAALYSHTHRHLPLNSFSSLETIKYEVDTAKEILERHDKVCNRYISFPFGMLVDYGVIARDYSLESGHEFVVEVGGGLNSPSRIVDNRIYSRVGLGATADRSHDIYTAIELRPIVKSRLKKIFRIIKS